MRLLRGGLLLLLLAVSAAQEECPPAKRCSACERFIQGFYAEVTRSKKMVLQIYKERIETVYETFAPEKVDGVSGLLKKAKGDYHDLYKRICSKYGAPPEDEVNGVESALDATVPALELQQWAQMVDGDKVTFVDFQKAMAGGSITGSISMGPDVTATMKACYLDFIDNHATVLVDTMAAAKRPYDSKLHTSFCDNIGACGSTDPDDFFEL